MSYGDHGFGLPSMNADMTHAEQIDMSAIGKYSIEQKLNLIEVLYRAGYLSWSREQITREINGNRRMVRTLGGTYSYLREWLKMGLENASHGRRVQRDDDDRFADNA
jgi:hypothetical protein